MPTTDVGRATACMGKHPESLKAGDVFIADFIDGYMALKMREVTKYRASTHPLEFQMYYTL